MKNEHEKEKENMARVVGSAHTEAERATASAVLPDSQPSPTPDRVSPMPLPWRQGPDYRFDIESPHGRVASGCPEFSPQADANAEYIVRAANAFPDLLAACKLALETVSDYNDAERRRSIVRAAISKAEAR